MTEKLSVLYSLSPRSEFGIESFTSYLMRLSEAHCIEIRQLFNKIIVPKLNKKYLDNSIKNGGNSIYDGSKFLNGMDQNAKCYSEMMNELTHRTDLETLTLWRYKDVLTTRKLLKNHLSWCTLCLKECDQIPYYPLFWFINEVTICPKHNSPLTNQCPICQKSIPILHRKSVIGYCPYCNSSLTKKETDYSNNHLEIEVFKSKEIFLFLSQITKDEIIHPSRFQQNLNYLVQMKCQGSVKRFSNYTGIPASTLYDWIKNKKSPTLSSVLILCYMFNLSLLDFLLSPICLNDKNKKENKIELIKNKKVKKIDYILLEKQLQSYIDIEEYTSIESIARNLRVSKKTLYRHYPETCKIIQTKNMKIRTKIKLDKREKVKKEISNAIESIRLKGLYPSSKRIEDEIGKVAYLRGAIEKEVWKELILKKLSKF